MLDIYFDSAGFPFYRQTVQLAQRYSLELFVVTRDYFDAESNVHLILAEERTDPSEWIAGAIAKSDICITAETALVAACLRRGAVALGPGGWVWTTEMLRDASRPDGVSPRVAALWSRDPRIFIQRLEAAIIRLRSARYPSPAPLVTFAAAPVRATSGPLRVAASR
jgi:uncharacterized protein